MSSYKCHFMFDGTKKSVLITGGLADFSDGFWVDKDLEPMDHWRRFRYKFWIPASQITFVEMLDLLE